MQPAFAQQHCQPACAACQQTVRHHAPLVKLEAYLVQILASRQSTPSSSAYSGLTVSMHADLSQQCSKIKFSVVPRHRLVAFVP